MFDNFPACDSWQCINSFSPWFSALGTILISGVALWLSIRDRYIWMDASFDVGMTAGSNPLLIDQRVYILSFTNIGKRPITVTNYEWVLPLSGEKRKFITFPQMDKAVSHLCTKLPVELTDGKSGHLFHVESFFRKIDKPEEFMYPKSRLQAWVKIHFFKMYISTSINKKIRVAISRRVRESLWKEYRAAE